MRLRGAGVVTSLTRTATSTGVLTPIYYKPTYFSEIEYRDPAQGRATSRPPPIPTGQLQLILPVGPYELVAYNPFYGIHTLSGMIAYAGQVINHEVVFEDAATVAGQVVGVDGITPVPDVEVTLEASGLKGQRQRTDADGRFRYELVPKGQVVVSARAWPGASSGSAAPSATSASAGQTLDLVVQMKAQGTVSRPGDGELQRRRAPAGARLYYLQEDSYPFRRIPEAGALAGHRRRRQLRGAARLRRRGHRGGARQRASQPSGPRARAR